MSAVRSPLAPLALVLWLALLGAAGCRSGVPPHPTPDASVAPVADAALLRAALAARCPPSAAAPPGVPCDMAARLYGPTPQPLWWTPQGPSPQARTLAAALRGAAARGLDPAHYATGAAAAVAAVVTPVPAVVQARRDVALSLSALRFVSDLAVGRVVPREAGFELVPDAQAHDLPAHIAALARAPDVERALAALEPPFATYRRLERALVRYRRLAADPTLAVALPDGVVHPGEPLPAAVPLRRLLVAMGDLAASAPTDPADVYGPTLAAAVARFQARHGIDADAVLGPATLAALRVPFETRVRQIVLALERFRWLPHRFPVPPVAVNIPEFRLYAVRSSARGYSRADDVLSMKVIVGESWERQTPVFTADLRSVVFWPFWDVPQSITREEMLPRLRRDPAYLAREHLELVENGASAPTPLSPTPENLDRLAAGALRLRQRPGPGNALGLVKFLFPNPYHVYMHGTPARGLFARERRDFSHGCIRVEDPVALAVHVLRDEPDWTRGRIVQAMEGPETRVVRLAHPLPVYVLYLTAVARPDGTVHFFPDVYGLDERLATLLERIPAGA